MNIYDILDKIHKLSEKLPSTEKKDIQILLNEDVIRWINGDLSFLEPDNPIIGYYKKTIKKDNGLFKSGKRKGLIKYKNIYIDDETRPKYKYTKGKLNEQRKLNEDKWNKGLMKQIRPDLTNSKQSKFGLMGEIILKELYILLGEYVTDKPQRENHHDLDLETIRYMIEGKTGSYFTTGTAGEKIFGVPYKYADVPRLYNKALLIVCIGGAETHLVNTSEVLERKHMKQIWEDTFDVHYVGLTQLLNEL